MTADAAHAADTACHLAGYRALSPEATVRRLDTLMHRALGCLLLVLLLWCLSCKTARPEAHATHTEHAAPANARGGHEANTTKD